jgi:hypothetical protein
MQLALARLTDFVSNLPAEAIGQIAGSSCSQLFQQINRLEIDAMDAEDGLFAFLILLQ